MIITRLKMPKRKFNKEQAERFWSTYTKGLSDSISNVEKEGLEKGLSSYEIERLWQEKTKTKQQRSTGSENK